ncbi:MAG TPA: hypothetical protein VJ698_23200 [Noviherbaspirillum sp.]|uniref:cytochrome oxidase putative small subunit CydP n=1 Tax=Noviherbaspirillum sp. TaxID=1926288 RepID=UPI002B46C8A7|nr:cytochrome oxidase putative small subunit CydP [Noviherbaspirillum sp.]HJV88395.1 hypothetical protein [Noviherbaspirillum sp.]
MTDRRLLRDLCIVLILKLLLLFGLWWAFVRDERVSVNAENVAQAIIGADSAKQDKEGGQYGH